MDQEVISTPIHLNNHLLCAMACRTSGPNPQLHELLELACIPLQSNWKVDKRFGIYNIELRPEYPQYTIRGEDYQRYKLAGLSREKALELFDNWFEKFNMRSGKKIVPICHDWPIISQFLLKWMGWEDYRAYFHESDYRDPRVAALYANDRADINNEQVIYARTALNSITSRNECERTKRSDVLHKAKVTAEVYGNMLTQLF
jgi:hypothetical protein